jgi:transposase-like protein
VTAADNSWFANCHLPIEKAIILMYSFSRGWTYEETMSETTLTAEGTSSETVANWFSYCREVCVVSLENKHETDGPMEGEIEIDESLIGKQKGGHGRVPIGTWVFGMYNRTTGEIRMVRCPDNKRDKATLIPIIQANIEAGSTVYSDQWPVYWDSHNGKSQLEPLGYFHYSVNHSENFVDPDTGADSQTIECYWRHLKTKMRRGGIPYENKQDHIAEFVYRRDCREKGIDMFEKLLRDIKLQFPV